MKKELVEERIIEEFMQFGLFLFFKLDTFNGFGRDDSCEQFLDCFVFIEVRVDENESFKYAEIFGIIEFFNMIEYFFEFQEMINWKLIKLNEMNDSQGNKENEKFLQLNQFEDIYNDRGGESDRTVEVGLDLKGICMNESEGCDFFIVTDILVVNFLFNCCDFYGMQSLVVCFILKILFFKEDLVIEEKEIEESKLECYLNIYEQRGNEVIEGSGLVLNSIGDLMKKNYLYSFCSQVLLVFG